MSEIEKAKATCARLKGHFTRAKNSLAKMLAARKGPEIIEEAFKEAKGKLTKLESHLEEMEGLDGIDDDWLSGEFEGIEDCADVLIDMTKQGEELVDELNEEDAGTVPTTGVSRILKSRTNRRSKLL